MKRRGFFGLIAGVGLSKMLPAKITEPIPAKAADKVIEAVATEVFPPPLPSFNGFMPYYSCSSMVFPSFRMTTYPYGTQQQGVQNFANYGEVVDITPPLLEAPKE